MRFQSALSKQTEQTVVGWNCFSQQAVSDQVSIVATHCSIYRSDSLGHQIALKIGTVSQ